MFDRWDWTFRRIENGEREDEQRKRKRDVGGDGPCTGSIDALGKEGDL